MKKFLLGMLVMLMTLGSVSAQNPTSIYNDDGSITILPAGQHTGKLTLRSAGGGGGVTLSNLDSNIPLMSQSGATLFQRGIAAGSGITITTNGTTVTFASSSGSGTVTNVVGVSPLSFVSSLSGTTFTGTYDWTVSNLTNDTRYAQLAAANVFTENNTFGTTNALKQYVFTSSNRSNGNKELIKIQGTNGLAKGFIGFNTDLQAGISMFGADTSGNITATSAINVGANQSEILFRDYIQLYHSIDGTDFQIMAKNIQIGNTDMTYTNTLWGTTIINSNLTVNGTLNGLTPSQVITNIASGTGISVSGSGNTRTVAVDSSVVLTSGVQRVSGAKTFTDNLVVTNANIGIGVNTPLQHIDSQTDGAADLIMTTAFGTGMNGNFIGRSARGTQAAPTASQTDDVLGNFGGRGYGATAFSSSSRSRIQFLAAEAWSDAAQGGYLTLNTTSTNSTTISERARVTSQGQFLIGATTPIANEKLLVGGTLKISGGAILPAVAVVTNGPVGSLTNDFSLASCYQVFLTNNVTVVPINYTNGQTMLYMFIQDGTGSRTVTTPFPITYGTDITSFTATTTANKRDRMGLIGFVNSTTNVADVVAVKKGF